MAFLPPAVAVMAKVPGAVPVKSRLRPAVTAEQAAALYRCFLLDRIDAVAGLVGVAGVVAYTPAEAGRAMAALVPPGFALVAQQGEDLGDRLAHVLGQLLAAGHTAALAIDSDSPTLPMAYVADGVRMLVGGRTDLVLGPSEDGGYYLVGLRAPCPALFDAIPWSTPGVLSATLARARGVGLRTELLPEWFDVDTGADLRRLQIELARPGDGPIRTRAFLRALPR